MISKLPDWLLERTRLHASDDRQGDPTGRLALYWMRTAVRSDENPALDVARWLANELNVPLLIYHAISEHYEYASDRHHTFMLQGARDVQRQLAELGLSYVFHLAHEQDREPHLVTLAEAASVVVTEEMPVDPPRRFLRSLQARINTPVVTVDTACVAPVQMVGKAYTRAFKYRSATRKIYAERLTRAWPQLDLETQAFDMGSLPMKPLDLQTADLGALTAKCAIDHSVGPVVDTVGGSTAGYRRWNEFKERRLHRYARDRNNALLDGVSRMSAYLHYGMVSPFRLAREAAVLDHAGAEKYLDELLIWRELAYAFCFYRDDHDQWSSLPQWAQETLKQHQSDLRATTYSWESLARGETDDKLWNAAQRSLLMQGELHNNVRMTWGKAMLHWQETPERALATLIDLNHRYALDGRDPASYGGLLWCLGQFDRPFEPETSVLGAVRPRSTSQHAKRLDPQKFLVKVATPRFRPVPAVAVIGAGISGLMAARTLQDHGLDVTVFEKSRGVGGRMSTRRIDGGSFDHGAQYFTVRDATFGRYVESWKEQGLVAAWPDLALGQDQQIVVLKNGGIDSVSDSVGRYVATPSMNAIGKHLSRSLDVRTAVQVGLVNGHDRLDADADRPQIELRDAAGHSLGAFDRLILAIPAAQAASLLPDGSTIKRAVASIEMQPCWAAMVTCDGPVSTNWVGAFLHDSFLSWAARNQTKPGRASSTEHLVIHATPEWTADHWDDDPAEVAQQMLDEFWRVSGIQPRPVEHLQGHRWKLAIPSERNTGQRCFANSDASTIACGDWACGSRVEGAFLSGVAAAGRVLGMLTPIPGPQPVSKQQQLF